MYASVPAMLPSPFTSLTLSLNEPSAGSAKPDSAPASAGSARPTIAGTRSASTCGSSASISLFDVRMLLISIFRSPIAGVTLSQPSKMSDSGSEMSAVRVKSRASRSSIIA